ncbi:SigE family RNA polymerase sigma factor [Actinoplanes sp. HUAS TT8]|uniref:SigE family RNA polymerase sigma factor n=1 Tax=Actinoplanes sp. HUAS TT8 TaxID=3447453 RepID=UPI003F523ACE
MDEQEFRGWAVAGRSGLRRTAFLLSGDWYLADDLVQEALVRVYLAWSRLERDGEITAYARRVLLNLYLDYRRRPGRRERPTDRIPDHAAPAGDGSDERDKLLAALRQVPPRQRAVLVLRFWEDLSVEQAAHALGTSTGNVKSQTSRGLATLRAALDQPTAFDHSEEQA